jgi:16S rRNA pseudouridine516 synthase
VSKAVRLDRLLANCAVGSRSAAGVLIRRGAVSVDGRVIRDPSEKVLPALFESVLVEGQLLDRPHGVCVLLHKPVGFACSHDVAEAPTVDELCPASWAFRTPRPQWAGRLDRATSGLLLISDDYQLIHRVTSPRHHVEKVYQVTLGAPLLDVDRAVEEFAVGLVLHGEDRACLPAVLSPTEDPLRVDVVLSEGRYHQVRRMISAVGGEVVLLHRIQFGQWTLGDLAPGAMVEAMVEAMVDCPGVGE